MSRTPARIRQADVARAIRAAQQCNAGAVVIQVDGTITIQPQPKEAVEKPKIEIVRAREIVL